MLRATGPSGPIPVQTDPAAVAPFAATAIEKPAAPGGTAQIHMGVSKDNPTFAGAPTKLPVTTMPRVDRRRDR